MARNSLNETDNPLKGSSLPIYGSELSGDYFSIDEFAKTKETLKKEYTSLQPHLKDFLTNLSHLYSYKCCFRKIHRSTGNANVNKIQSIRDSIDDLVKEL